ncbi:hypothetical protein [Polynucleobacter sp. JS-Polo-80-F4]|uniref:hypothetical protein n=1 Tax=Polynucleobacter sp. JS-Polo-80-F4 TaxID=2576918 RepID=UPI001C0D62DE|nr:hypothetical protein [Polynucleobacter sp. JS-Polo-80-F4]MBU3617274.1 hypothetical protein [Polynucleobacter sp. JS-Polo-80-F4]
MKKPVETVSNSEIYELDRGTASPREKARRLKILTDNGTPYQSYAKRVGPGLEGISIELKRLIDRKITPALQENIGAILDKRFPEVYCDVRVYPNSQDEEIFSIDEENGWNDDNLHVLVNFVVSIPEDDSLDSMARATLLSFFQKADDWTASDPKISKLKKKLKLYDLLNIDVISEAMGNLPFNDFDVAEYPGFNLEIDCDGVIETKFSKLKVAALGPEILSKRIGLKTPLELKTVTPKNAKKEVPVVIAKLLDALGVPNIDPSKLKKTDNLYALCGYQDKTCLSLTKSFTMHFDVLTIIGAKEIISLENAVDFAIETLEMREDD